MAINSTKTTAIPGVATPGTPDQLAWGIVVTPKFTANGVTASLIISVQPYRADIDGKNPLAVGSIKRVLVQDVFAKAAGDPDFAAMVGQLQAMMQSYVTANGL